MKTLFIVSVLCIVGCADLRREAEEVQRKQAEQAERKQKLTEAENLKFYFRDRVKVVSGFYKGLEGVVLIDRTDSDHRYLVKFDGLTDSDHRYLVKFDGLTDSDHHVEFDGTCWVDEIHLVKVDNKEVQ